MMPHSTPASGDHSRSTPEVQKYRPRACQSCARSKMRCVWPSEPGATPCQRCTKIKAPCTLPEINPRRRRGPSTRVGQLEEKIDGIMSLLNASQQIQQNSPSPGDHSPPSSSGPTALGPEQQQQQQQQQQHRNSIHQLLNQATDDYNTSSPHRGVGDELDPSLTPSSSSHLHVNARLIPPAGLVRPASISTGPDRSTGVNTPNQFMDRDARQAPAGEYVEIVKGLRLSYFEAERSLNLYRTVYCPYFPFVPIPVVLTSRELYDQCPFLFRTIMAITTPHPADVQAEYRVWFREYLAMSLVIDLGLNRWPMDFGKANFMMLKDAIVSTGIKGPWKKKHTVEEMRAALGTFYVMSLCASLFRRHHPMSYSSYLQKCCEVIAEAQEYETDKFLVALIKIHQLLNRAADIIPYNDGELTSQIPYTPSHMALTAIQKELETVIRQQPAEVEMNALLWTHYHTTLCRLYEPVIYVRSTSVGGYDPSDSTSRTAALWQCLTSARDFFTAYLSIPPQNLPCMPFRNAHLSFCLVTAVRLLFLGDESIGGGVVDHGWDAALARQAIDFEGICTRMSQLFENADTISNGLGRRTMLIHSDRSLLSMYRDKVRWMRDWYVARVRPNQQQEQQRGGGGSAAAAGPGMYPTTNRLNGGAAGGDSIAKEPGADSLGSGGAASTIAGGNSSSSNNSNIPLHGQAMDVDYSVTGGGGTFSGDLDDNFWQVMFDWNWGAPVDLMQVPG
ncbi:hypothetical protein M406DRAFT_289423 [Cryphonectria parasitica EP155]|uniref:Zn(2)-C6 fungal-type domain-containing protein n=1 Tax=Cryphonectria parasitica (strain ATCC 38755 / EP155) TaxID=660469 RepID=A0A9P4Y8M8_CRYP1|nr:uncharacterized protein M406DRAFT_289423 [Cryphonectria parasitica EP155]KAF3768090.1 hypothetical protein M406DRAFT_289423 [Cryphonectria parasitica EP155]